MIEMKDSVAFTSHVSNLRVALIHSSAYVHFIHEDGQPVIKLISFCKRNIIIETRQGGFSIEISGGNGSGSGDDQLTTV